MRLEIPKLNKAARASSKCLVFVHWKNVYMFSGQVFFVETLVASFTKDVNLWLAKCPLRTNGHLDNLGLPSLLKEATDCKMKLGLVLQIPWHQIGTRDMIQYQSFKFPDYIDGLVQERRNSIANALELRLSCTNPTIYGTRVWSSLYLWVS